MRMLRRLSALVVLALVGGLSAVVLALPATAAALPFTDENVNGYIGFCDQAGQQVTSGSVASIPFIWTAVSSTGAPANMGVKYLGKATLYAYQPRQDVDPGEWSGMQLTAGSAYTNDSFPMAQATTIDPSLNGYLGTYPAVWDGLVELRMIYTAPNHVAYTDSYPATVIKVTGNSWTEVTGGTVKCDAGKSISAETVYLPPSKFKSSAPAAPTAPAGATGSASTTTGPAKSGPSGSTSAGASGSSGAKPNPGASPTQSGLTAAAKDASKSGSGPIVIAVGLVVVLAVAAGGALWWRRRPS
jgi:hypothetical protein